MKVLVLGAGVIGTTTAWFLRERGHDVTVLERQPAAAMETSFANGGQISVSHVEPWANPQAPLQILKWLGKADAPLLFRPRMDARQWRWGAQFLLECAASRHRCNMRQIVALNRYSGACLRELRAATGLRYDDLQRGVLQIYTDKAGFGAAKEATELVRRYGVERELKTPDECIAIEPALARRRDWIIGGTYTATDESGDAHKFTQALAALAAKRGVTMRYGVAVESIAVEASSVRGVRIADESQRTEMITADAYVACLASYTPLLLDPIGISIPVYPLKGYSATFRIVEPSGAPTGSLTDDARKIVFTRLGDRLRVAGTAELSGYGLELDAVRCEALTRRARDWFGDAIDTSGAEYWAGLRPATPSNVPLLGRTRYSNLFLNTGHGTLGWTMAAGSGKALSDIVSGTTPEIDFAFTGPRS